MKFTLTAKIDDETGELGWKDKRIKSDAFGPLTYPVGLAHDILEHAAFESVADEIEAHGAMYRIRYEQGWCSEYGRGMELKDFAYEWEQLFHGLSREGYLPPPPKTRPLDSSVESDIDYILSEGRAHCIREFCDSSSREEHRLEQRAEIERIANVFRAHFRRGYRKVGQRFKGMNGAELSYLFTQLAEAFKRQRIEYEGQQIVVNLNLQTQNVSIKEIYEIE